MTGQRAGSVYEATLRMRRVGDLFNVPDADPLTEDYQEYCSEAGLEFLAGAVAARRTLPTVRLTVELPAEAIIPGLEARLRAGVRRWCRSREVVLRNESLALRWRGLREFAQGLGALFLFQVIARLLQASGDLFVLEALADALIIAGWVALWFPLDSLFFDVRHTGADERVYARLAQMDLRLRAWPEAPPEGGGAAAPAVVGSGARDGTGEEASR